MLVLSGGCSFIWGAELSDSPDYSGRDPFSRLTWPALWAAHHGFDYDTASQAGISNTGISRKIIDYIEHKKVPDFVIVQWTYPNRFEFRFNEIIRGNYFTMNQWLLTDNFSEIQNNSVKKEISMFQGTDFQTLAKIWYSYISNSESEYYYYLKEIVFLATYLKTKNIKYIFAPCLTDCFPKNVNDQSIQSLEKNSKKIPWILFNQLGFIEWAEHNGFFSKEIWAHPGDNAHYRAFLSVKKDIDNFFNI